MVRKLFGILSGLVLVFVVACVSQHRVEDGSSNPSWSAVMQELRMDVIELAVLLFDDSEFLDQQNHQKLVKQIKTIQTAAHKIPFSTKAAGYMRDPLIQYNAKKLNQDFEVALDSFQNGYKTYAQGVLKDSLNTCVSCHTRTKNDFSFNFSLQSSKLRPLEQVKLYTATRQYDKAVQVLENILLTENNVGFRLESALQQYVALMVRVKKEPKLAEEALTKVLNREAVPKYLKDILREWVRSLHSWKLKRELSLVEAKQLLKKSRVRQEYSLDPVANIDLLRVTSVLHGALSKPIAKKSRAQIYRDLGEVYGVLEEMGYWGLDQVYFEACIREMPRSSIAKSCYKDYERVLLIGFQGSGGVFLPLFEKMKLKELSALAGL